MQLAREPTPTTSRTKAPRVADPEPYHGDREKFDYFISQLHLVLNTDPERYSQDTAKLAYTESFLRGSAKRWFTPHVDQRTGAVSFPTFPTFIMALKVAFEDPDAAATAERKLRSLT